MCTYTPSSFGYSCNQSWVNHPVGQTVSPSLHEPIRLDYTHVLRLLLATLGFQGSMAEMQGTLFVACTPQTFYATTQIAVINTSAAKVITTVEEFERYHLKFIS